MIDIEPCPHCGEKMIGDADFMTHPKSDCILSEWEFDQPNVAAWNRRATPQVPTCRHRIADARNPYVESGYLCVDCGAVFAAADHAPQGPTPAAAEGQADEVGKAELWDAINEHVHASEDMMRDPPQHGAKNRWVEAQKELKVVVDSIFAAPLPRQAAVQGEDTARLDWLEQAAESLDGLMLHDGRHPAPGRNGLGLRYMGRTLRQAVDACMPTPAKVVSPSENSPAPTVKASQ
jgi:hypothetical protein